MWIAFEGQSIAHQKHELQSSGYAIDRIPSALKRNSSCGQLSTQIPHSIPLHLSKLIFSIDTYSPSCFVVPSGLC